MSDFASTLMDMGFPKDKVERALEVTGNLGVEPAMEWLLAHGDDLNASSSGSAGRSLTDPPATPAEEAGSSASAETTETAKSLKCEECGKLFKSQLEVEFHATKSGHSQFSESTEEKKPLTEEEKRQQMALLEQKLKEKKREREEKEKEEALAREKNRIRSGKEIVAAKKKLEDEELKKAIELRKREKEADKLARQKIIAQIEADKQARRAKAAGGTGQGEGAPPAPVAPVPAPAPISAPPKDYSQTRLQIRLTDGSSITQSFGVKEQLSSVRLYVEMNRTDNQEGPFSLMTTFPRKVFVEEDYEKPLDVLGLVPSAVLIVTKAPV
uniref:UBX domain-containing protein 1 n=1 Tax=Lygus hesperus TaxID=30085 RepID=A0A0A9XYU0_LYGHE